MIVQDTCIVTVHAQRSFHNGGQIMPPYGAKSVTFNMKVSPDFTGDPTSLAHDNMNYFKNSWIANILNLFSGKQVCNDQ